MTAGSSLRASEDDRLTVELRGLDARAGLTVGVRGTYQGRVGAQRIMFKAPTPVRRRD
jgi:hypothetical protein